ncbi:CubicO group peptidase (beta-lactamase class C family) [Variovorax sp. 1140]|uniref:serine hydrolase domain-containing protein n=1 Tax=Variovorax atrisoli TaxID=3394203 RepID=UPI00339A6233
MADRVATAAQPARVFEWQVTSPESQGIAASGLEAALTSGSTVGALRSLLVVRNGVLVGERYYGGATASDLLAVNSATKSVCSMLVGQALQQGKLKDLSQTVRELLPDHAQKAPNSPAAGVTLEQILTGTTGLAYEFTTQLRALATSAEPVQYVFGLQSDGKVANTWSYNDAAVSLLTPILERAQGLPLEEIATRDLFGPLGIEKFSWGRDKGGNSMAYVGLKLRTRDLVKLAWLMADTGMWNGKSVLPGQWVADSTRVHTSSVWRNPPIVNSGYGYLWFTGTLGGKSVAWAWGYGGQFALFVPSLKLAIATAATDPRPQDLRTQTAAVMDVVAQVVEVVS